MKEGKKVSVIEGQQGFCFLGALCEGLLHDHDIVKTVEGMKTEIMDYLLFKSELYTAFYKNNPEHLVQDVADYLNSGDFDQNVVDVFIQVALDALKVTLKIYQKDEASGRTQLLTQKGREADKTIFVAFTRYVDPENPEYQGANHYDPVVNLGGRFNTQEEDPESPELNSDIGTPHVVKPSTSNASEGQYIRKKKSSPPTARQKAPQGSCTKPTTKVSPICIDSDSSDSDIIIDLTSVKASAGCERKPLADVTNLKKKEKRSKDPVIFQAQINKYMRPRTEFPEHLFRDVEPEEAVKCPDEIDGNVVYKVKVNSQNYQKKWRDRRNFQMVTSGDKIDPEKKRRLASVQVASYVKTRNVPMPLLMTTGAMKQCLT